MRGGYLLVARAALVDGLVHLLLYDDDHPDGIPGTYRPEEPVRLACRDLIEPDDRLTAWTDARWRRAHRHGAAIALTDQAARSVGLPPMLVTPGKSPQDETDRINAVTRCRPRRSYRRARCC